MDHALREAVRPARLAIVELAGDDLTQTALHAVGQLAGLHTKRAPTRDRERIRARHLEAGAGQVKLRQGLADRAAMAGAWTAHRHAVEKRHQRRRPPRKLAQGLALPI